MTRFEITLTWNGEVVLEGRATAVTAFETARQHIEGNFVNAELAAFMARPDTFGKGALNTLIGCAVGDGLGGVFGDETGSASFKIQCVKA